MHVDKNYFFSPEICTTMIHIRVHNTRVTVLLLFYYAKQIEVGQNHLSHFFAYWSERMLCSTYWNVDKNVYPHKQRIYIIYFFHDTQKIPRKIYALFACLKGEMIAMKKRFHIQNTPMFPIAKLLSVWMNEYVYNKTYGINVYKNQNLDI